MVKTTQILQLAAAMLVTTVLAIDCSASEVSKYNFGLLKGTKSVTEERETPPTKTKTTWNVGICQDAVDEAKLCPKDADVCGITEVLIDGKYKVTQVISFGSALTKSYESLGDGGADGVRIVYKGATWGPDQLDAQVSFLCPGEGSDKTDEGVFRLKSWDGKTVSLEVISKAGCITSDDKKSGGNEDKDKNKDKVDKGESWGWFTWIFIFLVLFLSIYIIGGAWFQYHKSNSIDFQSALREVLENFVDLLRGLPVFVREVI
mgnify:CR=1 FL=1